MRRRQSRDFALAHGNARARAAVHLRAGAPVAALRPHPDNSLLTLSWTPLGPGAVLSPVYGNLTGRITAIAPDPNDSTGNTVYLGTTGGGVWKSTNAAESLSGVSFVPLTDTLPVFAQNGGGSAIPSLSIGAVALQPINQGVLLAGTGDPNDATDSLYGEGLLRSTDGGLTWTLIAGSQDGANGRHSFTDLATAALAWSTATPTLAVAAFSTSPDSAIEGATPASSVPGIYYSTDAGVTWRMATLYDGSQVVQQPLPSVEGQIGNPATSVVWNAARARFFAAVRGHGYYSSPDGVTWTRLTTQPGTGLTTANCPANDDLPPSANCPIFRGTLAVQPVTGDMYALTVDSSNRDQGLWQDLCQQTPAGTCTSPTPAWSTRLDNGTLEVGSGSTVISQGDYNLALSAAPAAGNATLLFAGTIDLYRCSLAAGASACAWRNTTNALNGCAAPAKVAPAEHALAAIAQSSGTPLLFLGNDGGLWRSLDGVDQTGSPCAATDATHFDNLNAAIANGGSLSEVVGFAQSSSDGGTLLAGLGALGSAATTAAGSSPSWPLLSAGEGGFPLLDPNTPGNWFLTIGAGVDVKACAQGTACTASDFDPPATVSAAQVGRDTALLHAPVLLDPALTTGLLAGTCRVWRGPADNGSAWTASDAISPAMDGGAIPCSATSALIRSLGAGGPLVSGSSMSDSGSSVLYAGVAGLLDGGGGSIAGHVFVTRNAGAASSQTAWTDIGLSPVTNDLAYAHVFNPGQFDVSSIAVDPHDATGGTVYVTVLGFGDNGGVPYLYRSTDFGAHWLNVSANLPYAPADAVLVDPNDANTVYVATDAGVFVTQAVTTCATASCWSVLGTGLPDAPVTALAAGPGIATGDGRRGMLRASTYGRGLWQQPLLTAISLAQPAITVSVTSLTFAAQQQGTASAAQTVTLTSSGNAPALFGTPAITGDFTESDSCAGQTLPVGASCTFQVVFAPTNTGARTGLLTIYANVSGGQATVSLSGTGTAPASIVLTPLSLGFAATTLNQTSAAQIVTVANTGGTPAALSSITASGDFFLAANTCGATLAPQNACSISLVFKPTGSGTRTGTLTVIDSVGTQTAQLTGTGQAPATDALQPLSLTFSQQQIGTTSTAQQATLTNSGDQPLTLVNASATGDFTATSACGTSLAPHATCAVGVAFVPTATGARSGTLTVSDEFRTQTIALTGTGVAPPGVSLTPSSLTFAATGVGLASAAQTVTLTNNGGLPLNQTGVAVSLGFAVVSSTCGTTLASGAACSLQIAFAPAAAGVVTGSLTLTDNGPNGAQTVALTGTAIDFTLTAGGPASMTVGSGTTATYALLLSSASGLSGSVAFACSGAPAHALCTVNPAAGALGSTVPVNVTVQTGLSQVRLLPLNPPWLERDAVLLACLLPIGLWGRRRGARTVRRATTAALCVLLPASLLLIGGCGAGRLIPVEGDGSATPSTPTASGTYNLTVTGSAAGVSHAVGLTLIVQ